MERTPLSIPSERPAGSGTTPPDMASNGSRSSLLQLVGSFDDLNDGPPPKPRPPAPDWSGVIERVQQAAAHVREVEARAHEQELRVRQLLARVREDVNGAVERARAADARATELHDRCVVLLGSAAERVKAAAERAHIAEDWLARVHDAIVGEFGIEPDPKTGG